MKTEKIYEVVGFPVLVGQFWHCDHKPCHQMHGPLSGFGYCKTEKVAISYKNKLKKENKIHKPEIRIGRLIVSV